MEITPSNAAPSFSVGAAYPLPILQTVHAALNDALANGDGPDGFRQRLSLLLQSQPST